jgi:protein TonB
MDGTGPVEQLSLDITPCFAFDCMIMVVRALARSVRGERARSRPTGRLEGFVGLALALHLLGGLVSRAFVLSSEMRAITEDMRQMQRDLWRAHLDVGIEPEEPAHPAPPPEEAAPREPEAVPSPAPPPKVMTPRAPESPPEPLRARVERAVAAVADRAAEAAKALTRDDDPPDAVAIASGDSDTPLSGMVAGAGKGTTATFNPRAALEDKPGAGNATPRPAASISLDRSRRASVIPTFAECTNFPSEAYVADVRNAVVVVTVRVRPNGTAEAVRVVSDPGHGFGEAARECAFRSRYVPARDRAGNAITAETAPINVRFTQY